MYTCTVLIAPPVSTLLTKVPLSSTSYVAHSRSNYVADPRPLYLVGRQHTAARLQYAVNVLLKERIAVPSIPRHRLFLELGGRFERYVRCKRDHALFCPGAASDQITELRRNLHVQNLAVS
jgi:hypothetical protein